MNAPFENRHLRTTLRKMGNSTGMIVPKAILDELGMASGSKIDVRIEDGKIVAAPVKRNVREGWEEDAKRIGALGLTEEELEWLEFDDPIPEDWGPVPEEWLTSDPTER